MSQEPQSKGWPRSLRSDRPSPEYPIATIAYYGPDDYTPTKIAVGILTEDDELAAIERWAGPDVTTNLEIMFQIQRFIEQHQAKTIVMTDGIIGCPHEEGIDYPEGEDCPFCPFWQGKQ